MLNHTNTKLQVKFDGNCLKQEKGTFTHKKVINIYVVYEINLWAFTQGADFTLENSLSEAVKLTKYADFDKYKYSGHGVGFDICGISCYQMVVGLVKILYLVLL